MVIIVVHGASEKGFHTLKEQVRLALGRTPFFDKVFLSHDPSVLEHLSDGDLSPQIEVRSSNRVYLKSVKAKLKESGVKEKLELVLIGEIN